VVSPLYRAIQTATIIFADQIAAGTKIICNPLATECLSESDDLGDSPANIREKWKSFPTIDFSILPQEEVWFYTPEPRSRTLELARTRFKEHHFEEPWEHCVSRVAKLEAWLAARSENVIAVVAHGDSIEALTGQDLDNATFYVMPIEARKFSVF